MILGVGIDLLSISRVDKVYNNHKDLFINKTLSIQELQEFDLIKDKNKQINYLAKKFSTKESFVKCIGIGLGRGIKFADISILHDVFGKPIINVNDKLQQFIEKKFNTNFDNINFIVTITDQNDLINTLVIMEKIC